MQAGPGHSGLGGWPALLPGPDRDESAEDAIDPKTKYEGHVA